MFQSVSANECSRWSVSKDYLYLSFHMTAHHSPLIIEIPAASDVPLCGLVPMSVLSEGWCSPCSLSLVFIGSESVCPRRNRLWRSHTASQLIGLPLSKACTYDDLMSQAPSSAVAFIFMREAIVVLAFRLLRFPIEKQEASCQSSCPHVTWAVA